MTLQADEQKKGSAENPYTLTELATGIGELEQKKLVLTGTIIGACKSGCKMWVADGEYKEGGLYALVRAKDDAFKFDTRATGKTAQLHGFAVAKLMDYCGKSGQEKAESEEECAKPVASGEEGKKECSSPGVENLQITFFATDVKYISS